MFSFSTTWAVGIKAGTHVIKVSTGAFVCWEEINNKESNHKHVISVQNAMVQSFAFGVKLGPVGG